MPPSSAPALVPRRLAPVSRRRWPLWAAPLVGTLLLAACGGTPQRPARQYEPEAFSSTTTHTRSYPVDQARTCEAARRALLSQGYQIVSATADQVTGRKQFQPEGEVHLEVEFRVVCANEQGGAQGSIAFAAAVQDRYELKKVNNSASVGVGAIGSLSVPMAGSNDAMVKVASQTLTDDTFYDRFFTLIERFLGAPLAPESRRSPVKVPALTAPVATPVARRPAVEMQPLAPHPQPPEEARPTAAAAAAAAPEAGPAPTAAGAAAEAARSSTPPGATLAPDATGPAPDAAAMPLAPAPVLAPSPPAPALPVAPTDSMG